MSKSALKERVARWALSWLVDAANPRERGRRPQEPASFDSTPKEVTLDDWRILVSDSRKIYANVGPAKAAIDDRAMYSVGRSWLPKFEGENREWGETARNWLVDEWYPIAEVRGTDFQSSLNLISIATDRDGDVFVLFTESEDGYPQFQIIPAHMVGQRNNEAVVKDGPYRGLAISHGVITNKVGRAVAYRVLGPDRDGKADTDISARDMVQIFDPTFTDQLRGFPAFTHALLDLKDLRMVQGYEKMAAAIASSIGLVEHNELGSADPGDPLVALASRLNETGTTTTTTDIVTSEHSGGMVKYFKSGSGGKLEQLENNRPGEGWERLMNRLIRNACAGAGWPYELTWDSSALGGANVRLIVAKAMRSVEDRQDLLRPFARRFVGWAVAKQIKRGKLAASEDWWKWGFTLPARMSVDYGRDGNSVREDYKLGLSNLGDILAEEGRELHQHIKERAAENAALEVAGLPVPDDERALAAEPPPAPVAAPEPQKPMEATQPAPPITLNVQVDRTSVNKNVKFEHNEDGSIKSATVVEEKPS